MKTITKIGLFFTLVINSQASITLDFQAGRAFNSFGTRVLDGTPYALLVSADNVFAGGFGLNQGLGTIGNANTTFSTGQAFTLGSVLGSDTVFGVGVFNGLANSGEQGLYAGALPFNLGSNGLAAGLSYAFYFFPGGTLVSNTVTIGNQVGGINNNRTEAGLQPMVIPADGTTITTGAASTDFGGTLTNAQFTAVNLVPEPSALLLSSLGFLALLRRKR